MRTAFAEANKGHETRILGAGHSLRQLQLFGNVVGPEAAEAARTASGSCDGVQTAGFRV